MKKKLTALFLCLLLVLSVLTGCSSSDTSSTENDDETFIIGVDDEFPPMGFRDENGDIVGFDIDLAEAVAEKMGMKFVVQKISWDAKELELDQGNIDAIWNGLTITDERKEQMLFTDPYLENDQVIVVGTDSDIKTKADLKDKNVGVQKGSSALDAIENDADNIKDTFKDLVEYDDNVSAFNDLENGRLDAVVVDKVVADYYVQQKEADGNATLVVLDESLSPELYGIAVKSDNTELRDKIQKALDEVIADGTAAEISEKWFGSDIIYTGK